MVDHHNLAESSAVGVTAVVLVISTFISLYQIVSYARNMKYKSAQIACMLLFTTPMIVGWSAWASLYVGEELKNLDSLVTIDKAFCITMFLILTEMLLGWTESNGKYFYTKETEVRTIVNMKEAKWLLPCIKPSPLSTPDQALSYLWKVRIGTYQVVFVIITVTIITAALLIFDSEDFKIGDNNSNSVWLWLNSIRSISCAVALFYLVNYAFFAARIPELNDLKIRSKFYLIKLSMIFTEIQPLIISYCAGKGWIADTDDYSQEEITSWTNSLLLCSEMIIVGFIQILVFPVSDYDTPPSSRKFSTHGENSDRLLK
ncbi:unnamed protein product [Blepharisma stoltei]|uniref:Uncharacterized protein n=1 Tax=Blepharisma stoltei TaxID=1481888 RepID=A0AAU9JGU1_9CILI|nr:unnamed protein product [Blepharisma stoltei]